MLGVLSPRQIRTLCGPPGPREIDSATVTALIKMGGLRVGRPCDALALCVVRYTAAHLGRMLDMVEADSYRVMWPGTVAAAVDLPARLSD